LVGDHGGAQQHHGEQQRYAEPDQRTRGRSAELIVDDRSDEQGDEEGEDAGNAIVRGGTPGSRHPAHRISLLEGVKRPQTASDCHEIGLRLHDGSPDGLGSTSCSGSRRALRGHALADPTAYRGPRGAALQGSRIQRENGRLRPTWGSTAASCSSISRSLAHHLARVVRTHGRTLLSLHLLPGEQRPP
jgi:hypothetical protein